MKKDLYSARQRNDRLMLQVFSFLFILVIFSLNAGILATSPLSESNGGVNLPPEAGEGWWANVQKDIAEKEYHVSRVEKAALQEISGGVFQAPNRAHNLRTYFTMNGPRVIRRTGESPEWVWGLELLNAKAVKKTQVKGNRFEYHREGGLVEWYVNDPKGLEQGFTITNDEGGRMKDEIALEIAVRGDLIPGMMPDGKTIEFLSEGGVGVIHYGKLKAWDSGGKSLPSKMELVNHVSKINPVNGIRIIVDTQGALFPVTIDPTATCAAWTAESNQASANFGWSVSTAGDVNGDGYSDVIVGARNYDNGQSGEGRAYVYHGSASGLSASAAWTAESDQADAHFGCSVSTAGDVNGDGYSDVIVGAFGYDNGETDEGRAYVYHGSASGLSASASWTAESDQAGAWFGWSVSTAGDVNGDGYSDVIVGAELYDNGETDEGRAYVYHGSASGLSASAAWTAESDQASASFGCSVSTAGDVNGDGYSDVIVGAKYYDNGETGEGRAYVYHGSASGLSASADWTAESDQGDAFYGCSVSTAGDVNGDGYSDVIVGAYCYDNGEYNEGRAFVYYGNGESGPGLSLIPQQHRADDSATVDCLCGSGEDGVSIRLNGRTPYGRGKLKMEIELKPLGTDFNSTDTVVSSSWDDISTCGITLTLPVDFPTSQVSVVYKWRARLIYHPATTPFQQYSRWLTMSWNGLEEGDFRLAAATAPVNPGATNIQTDAITWTWDENSLTEDGFKIWCCQGTTAPGDACTYTEGADATQCPVCGFTPNTQYAFQAAATWGDNGDGPKSDNYTTWTLAATPVAPALSNVQNGSIDLVIGSGDGNPAGTQYAIYCETTGEWVQTSGGLGSSEVWNSSAGWGAKTVYVSSPDTYTFKVKAKNGAGVPTSLGTGAGQYVVPVELSLIELE